MIYINFKAIKKLQYHDIENYIALSQKYIYPHHQVTKIL